jgi:hypothetical protein
MGGLLVPSTNALFGQDLAQPGMLVVHVPPLTGLCRRVQARQQAVPRNQGDPSVCAG